METDYQLQKHMAQIWVKRRPKLFTTWSHEEIVYLYWEVQDVGKMRHLPKKAITLLNRYDWKKLPKVFSTNPHYLDYLISNIKQRMESRMKYRLAYEFTKMLDVNQQVLAVLGDSKHVPWSELDPIVTYSIVRKLLLDKVISMYNRGEICLVENGKNGHSLDSQDKESHHEPQRSNDSEGVLTSGGRTDS